MILVNKGCSTRIVHQSLIMSVLKLYYTHTHVHTHTHTHLLYAWILATKHSVIVKIMGGGKDSNNTIIVVFYNVLYKEGIVYTTVKHKQGESGGACSPKKIMISETVSSDF